MCPPPALPACLPDVCAHWQVHALGSLPASGDELMLRVTGSPLRPADFIAYLEAKFAALYP